jgi:hypothetical protein
MQYPVTDPVEFRHCITPAITLAAFIAFSIGVVKLYTDASTQNPSSSKYDTKARAEKLNKYSFCLLAIGWCVGNALYTVIAAMSFVLQNDSQQHMLKFLPSMIQFQSVDAHALTATIMSMVFACILFSNNFELWYKANIAAFVQYKVCRKSGRWGSFFATMSLKMLRVLFATILYVLCKRVAMQSYLANSESPTPHQDRANSIMVEYFRAQVFLAFSTEYITMMNPVNAVFGAVDACMKSKKDKTKSRVVMMYSIFSAFGYAISRCSGSGVSATSTWWRGFVQ